NFTEGYDIAPTLMYYIRVTASLVCDPTVISNTAYTEECVNINSVSNVELVSFVSPSGTKDVVGSTQNIEVEIKNTGSQSFSNVTITALIEDEDGINNLEDIIATIPASTSSYKYSFQQTYTVPNFPDYNIKVYLTSVDNNSTDDTITTERTTDFVGINRAEANVFTLGQNTPNPANNSTRIDYSIPEAGEVIFHVHSISGQLLYSKTIEAQHGNQSIELNTSTLASGIYFYSIEYKGQCIVKHMNIQK
ncbi:MAG: T9SS type A sorting domain-containing protein, partial [Prevotella sp.]|nr:T9SS type A sorting domain-containing protein [Prevotella sp.]